MLLINISFGAGVIAILEAKHVPANLQDLVQNLDKYTKCCYKKNFFDAKIIACICNCIWKSIRDVS